MRAVDETPDDPTEVNATEAPPRGRWASFGRAILAGATVVGGGVARGAVSVGRGVSAGWNAIDPDLRRMFGEAPLLGVTLLASRDDGIVALPDDGQRPVVFVHGLGGHRGNFALMRGAFDVLGRSRTYSITLEEGRDIDALGELLRERIARVIEVNGLADGDQVDLVAHSMGGVVSRVALEDPATAARVRTLVTLGTPHSGTHLARLADTARTRAMRPGSTLYDRLAAQVPWPGPPSLPRLVCFWSRSDTVILPAETSVLEGAEAVELEGITHTGFLLHPRSFTRVLEALR